MKWLDVTLAVGFSISSSNMKLNTSKQQFSQDKNGNRQLCSAMPLSFKLRDPESKDSQSAPLNNTKTEYMSYHTRSLLKALKYKAKILSSALALTALLNNKKHFTRSQVKLWEHFVIKFSWEFWICISYCGWSILNMFVS